MVRDPELLMLAQRALAAISPDLLNVADDMGVSYNTVMSWQVGKRTPGPENLRKLAAFADRGADKLRGLAVELRRAADGVDEPHN